MNPVVKRGRFLTTLLEVSGLNTPKFNYPCCFVVGFFVCVWFFFFFFVKGFNKFFREDGIKASLSWDSMI